MTLPIPRDSRAPAEYWAQAAKALSPESVSERKLRAAAQQEPGDAATYLLASGAHLAAQGLVTIRTWRALGAYSAGEPIERVAELVEPLVDAIVREREVLVSMSAGGRPVEPGWHKGYYVETLTVIALALCVKAPTDTVQKLASHVDAVAPDRLLDRLLMARLPHRELSGSLALPRTYGALEGAFDTPSQAAIPAIQKYVSGWYATTKSAGWHRTHEILDPDEPHYFGCWCVEAAAVVALLGLDDTSLRNDEVLPGRSRRLRYGEASRCLRLTSPLSRLL